MQLDTNNTEMTITSKLAAIASAMFLSAGIMCAQAPILIHSHNDYKRSVPFYQAYAQGVASVEADIHYGGGRLLVGHDAKDLVESKTLESLYLAPIARFVRENGGHPYKDPNKPLQLLVDIKNDTEPSLSTIIDLVKTRYSDVFCTGFVRIIITGNRPKPEDFCKYPEWVMFDGLLSNTYDKEQLERVALISECFTDFAKWNGVGFIAPEQETALRKAIDKAHRMGKTIRFWGGPETLTAYSTFYNLGIDYFNTDLPEQCTDFFSKLGK